MSIDPITAFSPVAPDADWESVRAQIAADVAAAAPEWTDHNASDPGITLTDGVAYSLADLHYRVAERDFGAWPLASNGYRATRIAIGTTRSPKAVILARSRTPSRPCPARLSAWCAAPPRGPTRWPRSRLPSRPLRWPCGRTSSRCCGRGWSANSRKNMPTSSATPLRERMPASTQLIVLEPERDAAAQARLGLALPLWDEELAALVRRERDRLAGEAMIAMAAPIAAVRTASDATTMTTALQKAGLTPEQALLALALPPIPATLLPEDLEGNGGASEVWPPHGIQALTCEPVTDLDYARRARSHPQVGRAWAMPGRLGGIAWHGLSVLDPAHWPLLTRAGRGRSTRVLQPSPW